MDKYKNLIGNGSYGYIFYPPLEFDYEKYEIDKDAEYVTKLMLSEDGEYEIKNQILINNIDPDNEYQLGNFYKIKHIPKKINLQDFKLFKSKDVCDMCMVVQKYGGVDLYKIFKDKIISNYDDYKDFLVEFYRILEGINKLNKNNIIHHDINPRNIVYDKKNKRLNYIDFSLTKNKKEIIDQLENSKYAYSVFHSSFPIETGFYNKDSYEDVIFSDECEINYYCHEIRKCVSLEIKKSDAKIVKAIKNLFVSYYGINDKIIQNETINKLNLFLLSTKFFSYKEFIEKSLNTFDLYGYGLCLLYSLRFCDIYLSDELSDELYDIALRMADINVFTRLSIKDAQEKFKDILVNYKIINNK